MTNRSKSKSRARATAKNNAEATKENKEEDIEETDNTGNKPLTIPTTTPQQAERSALQIMGMRFEPAQGAASTTEMPPPAAQAPAQAQPPAANEAALAGTGLATNGETDAYPEIG